MKYKEGDILIGYRINSKEDFDFISIERVFIENNKIFTDYYRIDVDDYDCDWFYEELIPENERDFKIITLKKYKKNIPEELKGYEKEIRKIFHEFYSKYKVEFRKRKLEKLNI